MAQAITIDNFYPIANIIEWPGVVSKLEWSLGKQIAEHAPEMVYPVIGNSTEKGVWVLTMGEKDGKKGVYATLDGRESWNDPTLGGVHTAEDLATRLMQLRQVNTPTGHLQDIDTSEAIRGYETANKMAEGGFSNFYPITDEISWLEAVAKLTAWGDIEKMPMIQVKTSADGIETGVYTLRKIARNEQMGIEVDLDGGPTFNYPRPNLRSADEIVDAILKLHAMYSKGVRPRDFKFNFKDGHMVVASAKSSTGTEVKLYENGLITIASKGFMQLNAEQSQGIVDGLVSLVDEAVQPFQGHE